MKLPPRKSSANPKLVVANSKISTLKTYEGNPKVHSPKQLKLIAGSILANGFCSPILIDENDVIIAGHGRLEAAKLLGRETVPTIMLSHLNEAQKKKLRIADNRLAEVGSSWSTELLQMEFEAIGELEADFDMGSLGFDARDWQLSLDAAAAEKDARDPDIPPVENVAITRLGDLWEIASHKLICGDATGPEAYTALLGRERADMVFADAPYNVPIDGHVSGNGKVKHREFVAASGEMSSAEFGQFLNRFMMQCAKFSRSGSLHYMCMDHRHIGQLLDAGAVAYDEYKNLLVWVKTNGGQGSMYRSQHELIGLFKSGTAAHTNNIELGKHGRYRTNVLQYAGMNSFSRERDEALALHPTVKPLALVRDAILDASNRDDIVLDPFGGSGTTLLAADVVRRQARLIELDPLYCDTIIRRAEKALGVKAVLAKTGQTFDEVAAEREADHG